MERGLDYVRQVVSLRPNLAAAHTSLGMLLEASGDSAGALASYQKALEIEGDQPEVHNSLGTLLTAGGELQLAIQHFRKALELDPSHQQARHNLQLALRLQQDKNRP